MYESKFTVTPEVKLLHTNAQLPAVALGTPSFVGHQKRQVCICLHACTTYNLDELKHEITVIQIPKQNIELVPWNNLYGFFFSEYFDIATMECIVIVLR